MTIVGSIKSPPKKMGVEAVWSDGVGSPCWFFYIFFYIFEIYKTKHNLILI
ncbi:hypothetical protein HanRHA438_Chr11g0529071 [Helianthus annuus]|nr:hypothetical protein HanRHA438_Chr11g0529071 [Helianthus annuus]